MTLFYLSDSSVLTGTAAIRVGFSTVQSPLLPFLILLDYINEKAKTIRETYVSKNACWGSNSILITKTEFTHRI